MLGGETWFGKVNEDGSFSILSRVTSLDGTGTQVKSREGNCLKQADVDTITCKVLALGTDKNNPSGTEVTPAPTLTPAANLYDTLQTNGWPTEDDWAGYNFRHDIAPTFVPDGDRWYLFEYKFTLDNGGVEWLKVKVYASAVQTS